MAEAVSRRAHTTEAGAQSRVIPRELDGGQCGSGTGFSPNTSVFSCQYHSTNAPYSSSSACCSYQKDKRVKSGSLPKISAFSDIGEHWIEKYFLLIL
jgi:hypothetical protein